MIKRKLSHSSNVSEGNVMVGGKPVCDDNWGMEEVHETKKNKRQRQTTSNKDKDNDQDKNNDNWGMEEVNKEVT